jgi:flavin reductase (DIM6/NTAB) family NADH-FMN oxidoreductase RutF
MLESEQSIAKIIELVDRAVWVVTSAAGGRRSGLLASWVTPSSLDPLMPLVNLSLNDRNFTTELIQQSGSFSLHLLRLNQTALALSFGLRSGRDIDKFEGLQTTIGATGAPVLTDCLAALDCRLIHKVQIADRLYVWGRAVSGRLPHPAIPLSERALLASANPEQRTALQSQRERDANLQRVAWQSLLASDPTVGSTGHFHS